MARARLPFSTSPAPWWSCQRLSKPSGSAEAAASCAEWVSPALAACVRACLTLQDLNRGQLRIAVAPCGSVPKGRGSASTSACTPGVVRGDIKRRQTECEGGWCLLRKLYWVLQLHFHLNNSVLRKIKDANNWHKRCRSPFLLYTRRYLRNCCGLQCSPSASDSSSRALLTGEPGCRRSPVVPSLGVRIWWGFSSTQMNSGR